MKKTTITLKTFTALFIIAAMAPFTSCTNTERNALMSKVVIDSLRNQINILTAGNEKLAKNLTTFDTLDYTVFSNQEWTRLHESHSKDIKVYWPDGHFTIGIEKHIADLKALFI